MAAATAHPRLPDQAAYYEWLGRHFDLIDLSERISNGSWACNPTWAIERHRNAKGWRGRLPEYRRKQLQRHREGQTRHALVPRRLQSDDGNSISTISRIDIDAHKGQRDADKLLDLLRELIGPAMYSEASDRGASIYVMWTFPLANALPA